VNYKQTTKTGRLTNSMFDGGVLTTDNAITHRIYSKKGVLSIHILTLMAVFLVLPVF